MKTFTKRQAMQALEKLGLQARKSKHIQYKLTYNGLTILTTAVSKGRGTFKPVRKFKQQLLLNNSQLQDTLACPFGREEYIEHLKSIGRIPEEEEDSDS